MKYFHSWSGGKDSTAAIILDHIHGLPPSTVVFCEVMYDRKHGISGELPEHIDFVKNVAIPKFQEWGFTVDVIHSETDYLDNFFHVISKSRNGNNGKMRGFPLSGRCTINRDCKLKPIHDYYKRAGLKPSEYTQYVGIAIDEPERLERLRGTTKCPFWKFTDIPKKWPWNCVGNTDFCPLFINSPRGGGGVGSARTSVFPKWHT